MTDLVQAPDDERLQRLSRISTLWSLVQQAHGDSTDVVGIAQRGLLERYSGAVYRYLLGALGDREAADDLFQEFSLRFLRGDFRRADPDRGRFRDFVKTSLFHLIVDYQRRRRASSLPPDVVAPGEGPAADAEKAFLDSWRNELMDRTWQALARSEEKSGQPCHAVLSLRTREPLLSSAELAQTLAAQIGRPVSTDGVRQLLHRAREKFAELLVQEIIHSLGDPTVAEAEQELIDLGLFPFCKAALQRRHAT